jgi:hypothetical protein
MFTRLPIRQTKLPVVFYIGLITAPFSLVTTVSTIHHINPQSNYKIADAVFANQLTSITQQLAQSKQVNIIVRIVEDRKALPTRLLL